MTVVLFTRVSAALARAEELHDLRLAFFFFIFLAMPHLSTTCLWFKVKQS